MVSADLENVALVELMPQYRSLEFGIYAIYPSRQHLSPKVRVMIDFLVNAMKGVSWCDETPTWP